MRGMDQLIDRYDDHEKTCPASTGAKTSSFVRHCPDGNELLDAIAAKYGIERPPYADGAR